MKLLSMFSSTFCTKHPEPLFCDQEKGEHILGSSQSSYDLKAPELFSNLLPPLGGEKRMYASNHEI